jgi:hypothetical protein
MKKGAGNDGDKYCVGRMAVLMRKKRVLLASVMRNSLLWKERISEERISSGQSILIHKMW